MAVTIAAATIELHASYRGSSLFLASDALHLFAHVGIFAALLVPPGSLRGRGEGLATLGVVGSVLAIALLQAGSALRALLWGGSPPPAATTLLFSLVGLAANIASAAFLKAGADLRASFRAALAHELSDGALTIAALAGAVAIQLWGLGWVDPALCLATAISLATWCIRLLARPAATPATR